jgi:hypothetical protein
MDEEQVRSLFKLSGFTVERLYKLENKYWPDVPDYQELRKNSPWWLVKTEFGLIQIGWRKRVISINWEDTGVKCLVTTDEVTHEELLVHAYSYAKAVQYLTTLHQEITTYKGKVDEPI